MNELKQTGFFKCNRSGEALELLSANKNAFALLFLIAFRAQRTSRFNRHNLKPGQALIGDYASADLSEREYRTAKVFLQRHGFATFKATNSGTIATLLDTRVFDINAESGESGDEPNDTPTTIKGRTDDERPTTTKNEKKETMKEGKEKDIVGSADAGVAVIEKPISKQGFTPPTRNEVWEYGNAQNIHPNIIDSFLAEMQKEGWCVRVGEYECKPVQDWQQELKEFREKQLV